MRKPVFAPPAELVSPLSPIGDAFNAPRGAAPAAILNPEADVPALLAAALVRVELVERFARSVGGVIHGADADTGPFAVDSLQFIERAAEEARWMLTRAEALAASASQGAAQGVRHA